jgi:hypothetical protein
VAEPELTGLGAPALPVVLVEGPSAPRYLRQVLVAEVGASGQAALAAFAPRAPSAGGPWTLAERVAERYLTGAGVHAEGARLACQLEVAAPPELVRDEAAREVLAGSRAALAALAALLGGLAGRDGPGGTR